MEPKTNPQNLEALHSKEEKTGDWRSPPANLEAEQALLGATLVNNRAFEQVSDFLKPEHFGNKAHGRIFEALANKLNADRKLTLLHCVFILKMMKTSLI